MEKDVLLEFAHIGHLILNKEKTPEMLADSENMGIIWHRILRTKCENIDYKKTIEEIRSIRNKYDN